jgi:hypothetical protein
MVDRRFRWVALSALLLALVLGACRASGSTSARPAEAGPVANAGDAGEVPTHFLTYDEMVAEYRATLPTLSWPPDMTPNPDPMETDRSSNYEAGYGEGDAVYRWQCAWGDVYLQNRTKHPAVAKDALDHWASVTKLPAWNRSLSDPHTREVILDAISKARLGDPSVFQSIQVASC